MLTKMIPPTIKDPELNRYLRTMADNYNRMVDTINNQSIDVVKRTDNTYIVKAKSEDGDIQTSTSTFTPKTKGE